MGEHVGIVNKMLPLAGVLMVLMTIIISKHSEWTGISQIMKKDSDFRSSGRSCFSATKENKSVHYAVYFTTCNLTGMEGLEGKVSGPRRVSIHFEENFGILGHS